MGSVFPPPEPPLPQSQGSMESEGSWLSGKMDIEKAVRKSFAGSPARRTPPIILETSAVKGDGNIIPSGLMQANWTETRKPDYEGAEYGSEEEDEDVVPNIWSERVRQGSAARKVEVVDRPSLEGVAGRVSSGNTSSPERRSQDLRQNEIILA